MELTNTQFQYMILAIVALVAIEAATLLIVFATGVGKRVLQRINQRWRYKNGKHVNVIFLRNNHVSHEMFITKEADGSFLVDGKRYVINPLATFIHDGIPTQINHEGITEPYNIFSDKDADKMSTAEIESIIMNNEGAGLGELVKKFMFWTFIMLGISIIIGGAGVYFGFQLHDYIIKKELLKQSIILAQQAAQNVTMVAAR